MIGLHPPSKRFFKFKNLKSTIDNGWLSSSGPATKLFESTIKKYTKSRYALATINGTAALQLSIACFYPKKFEEILIPDISFISTVNAVHYNFCNPIFIGVNHNLLICHIKLKNFIEKETYFKNGYTYNKKSKKKIIALIVVNTFGNLSELFKIKNILRGKNIKIIEDAAESLGSCYINENKKAHAGTVGDVGCLSFNVNKIITTGGGGMILTNNSKIFRTIKHLANQSKKDPVKFIHDQVGFNYTLPSINASIGIGQIRNISKILKLKEKIYKNYKNEFKKNNKVKFISIDQNNFLGNFWLNLVKINNNKSSLSNIILSLKKKKIIVRPVWYPLSLQSFNKSFQSYKTHDSKIKIKNILCLPSGYDLTKKQQRYIIEEIEKIS
tara:strand:+ start:897 stop:2048 length:1152 start_codon:yes stop_codon:yes gene_type:complete